MPELTLEDVQREMRAGFAALKAELTDVKSEIALVRARVDGLPLIGSAIEVLQRDHRLLRAAVNDLARTDITAGEVQALHDDVDRALAGQAQLETRVATPRKASRTTTDQGMSVNSGRFV